ncbi:MAG: DUF192 domain-containing protein [Patescibacteria group bacterium]
MSEIIKLLTSIILSLQALLGANLATINNQPIPMPVFFPTHEVVGTPTETSGSMYYATTTILIGNTNLTIKIADTPAKRERGLSGTAPLTENEGMLFIFDQPNYYQFWMKDMNYPLDIIWVDNNYQIVDITPNLSPSTYPQTFTSKKSAGFVLEVSAGFSKKNQVRVGETIKVKSPP